MEAFKNLLNQLEIQQAEQRQREAEEATKQNELRKAQADLSLDEAIALYSTQLEASTGAADSAQKGRAIKSRGIALCHKDQGFSANGRPVSPDQIRRPASRSPPGNHQQGSRAHPEGYQSGRG